MNGSPTDVRFDLTRAVVNVLFDLDKLFIARHSPLIEIVNRF